MLEFALGGVLLLSLVVGTFDLSRALWTHTTLTYAAARAARFAMVHPEQADPEAVLEVARANAVGVSLAPADVSTVYENGRVRVVLRSELKLFGVKSLRLAGRAEAPVR